MAAWDTNDPFAQARRAAGVLENDFLGESVPLILRHRDIREAAADFRTFSSDAPFRVPIPSEESVRNVRQLPIETDPPDHGDYRAIVKPFFAAPKQPETIARVEALVAAMLDELLDAGPTEIVGDFALPLQSRALAILLGMPMDEADEWISWGQHVFRGPEGHSVDKGSLLDRYLQRQLDRAERTPGDDFFSGLVQAQFRGRPLTRDEMLGFANLAFAGGRDTVIASVSLAMAHLAEHPQDVERLRDDGRLIRSAAEEIFRIASPLTLIGRTCPHDTEINGVSVPAGGRVALCWASANRDEAVFENPDMLDIGRKRNPHVAFGAGNHTCLGASHARLVLRSLISRIAASSGSLRVLDSQACYETWPAYRRQNGFESLTMRYDS